MRSVQFVLLSAAVLAALSCGNSARAVPILAAGDPTVAIDLDQFRSASSFPSGENPSRALDNNTGTKYLNFGRENSGYIVTPLAGATTVQSFRLTTANDSEARDPASYELYGTNSPIASPQNSLGTSETWTLISSGALALPAGRQAAGPVVGFANGTAYTSYKMIFPTLKNAPATNSMQVAESQLYANADGTGAVNAAADPIIAIDRDQLIGSESPASGNENVANLLDNNAATKYLNFGRENSGFIVTPTLGPLTILQSITLTTANDGVERDPSSYALYGTNDPIVSAQHSTGSLENWTLISSGSVSLPTTRLTAGSPISISGAGAYSSYRLVFPTVRNTNASGVPTFANSMQLAGVQFEGTAVPEPSTWAMLAAGLAGWVLARRRR